jgi:hypothetical protein
MLFIALVKSHRQERASDGFRRRGSYEQTACKAVALNACDTTPFPILIDADRKLSKGLELFMTEWGQNTVDRPEYDYLFKVLEVVNGMR